MKRLENKVAVITGGARGMGEATARLFAQEGAITIIADVLADEGEKLASELGGAAMFKRLDVTDESGWEQLVAEVLDR